MLYTNGKEDNLQRDKKLPKSRQNDDLEPKNNSWGLEDRKWLRGLSNEFSSWNDPVEKREKKGRKEGRDKKADLQRLCGQIDRLSEKQTGS